MFFWCKAREFRMIYLLVQHKSARPMKSDAIFVLPLSSSRVMNDCVLRHIQINELEMRRREGIILPSHGRTWKSEAHGMWLNKERKHRGFLCDHDSRSSLYSFKYTIIVGSSVLIIITTANNSNIACPSYYKYDRHVLYVYHVDISH